MTVRVVRRSVVELARVVAPAPVAGEGLRVAAIGHAVRSARMVRAAGAGAVLVARAVVVRPAMATVRVAPLATTWVDRAHSGMATAVVPRVQWMNHGSGASAGNASSTPAVRVEEMTNEMQSPGASRGDEGREGRPGGRRGVVVPVTTRR